MNIASTAECALSLKSSRMNLSKMKESNVTIALMNKPVLSPQATLDATPSTVTKWEPTRMRSYNVQTAPVTENLAVGNMTRSEKDV
jgi:hypothetical protein